MGKVVVLDDELTKFLQIKRDNLLSEGHANWSYSNAIRSLVGMPHNDCSCDNTERRAGRNPLAKEAKT